MLGVFANDIFNNNNYAILFNIVLDILQEHLIFIYKKFYILYIFLNIFFNIHTLSFDFKIYYLYYLFIAFIYVVLKWSICQKTQFPTG